jgi:hypothetical protein
MNLLLGDQMSPVVQGVLGGAPVLTGTLDPTDAEIIGTLLDQMIHDLVLFDGQLQLSGGLAQRIDCYLRTFLGEWWADPTLGVPYFQEILKKNPDLSVVRQAILSVILQVPGVVSVPSLTVNLDRATRRMSVSFEATGADEMPVSGTSEVFG